VFIRGNETATDFEPRPPGPNLKHLDRIENATQTQDEYLLVLLAWRGDLDFDNYSMDT
jgi:hypothetical protein